MQLRRIHIPMVLMLFGVSLLFPTWTRANSAPMTRTAVVAAVLMKNPDMHTAVARMAHAAAYRDKAAAAFYPHIGMYTEFSQGDAPSGYLFKSIDQRELPPGTDFNRPGEYRNWESGIHGQWNLFNGGRDWARHRIANADVAQAGIARKEVINRLVTAAIKGYYDVLAAQEFARIAEESVNTVSSQRDALSVRYRAGGALKSDLLSLEARVALAQEAALRSGNRMRLARTALATLMGMDPTDPPALAPHDTPLVVPAPPTVEDGLRLALAQRPEVAGVRHRVTQAKLANQLSRGGYLPKVALRGRYYADDPNMDYATDRDNWTAAIVMEWALFSGFTTRAEHQGAIADLETAMSEGAKTILALKQDVTAVYLALDNATQRQAVSEKGVASAAASFDLVRRQYAGGSATITRYLDAELDLNRAKIQQTAARYDRQKALADLGRAIGHWPRQERTQP